LRPELKRLLQAASVVGKDVPGELIEAIGDMPADDLRQGLAELQAAEFLYETRLFPDLEYTFKHALTHEVAYGSLLQDRRRALHAALVDAVERLHADRLVEHVEVLAHHAVRGGITAKALRYLAAAGEKSFGRSATREAVAFFQAALAILDEVPETPEAASQRLDILIALGPALIVLHNASAPEVEQLYQRALELVEHLGDVSRRFPVLWGLWFVSYTQGRYPTAREAAGQLLEAAQAGDDTDRLLEAHHALWATLFAIGQSGLAVAHMERGIALYERERHAAQTFLYGGHDPGVCCRYQLAGAQWLLGYPERAAAVMREALRLADDLKHPQTMTMTLWVATWLQYQRGERVAAAETAARVLALADAQGFEPWTDAARVVPMAMQVPLTRAALESLHHRLMVIRSSAWRRVFCLCTLAEVCIDSGQLEQARLVLASIGDADRQAFSGPEVYRIEGEILLRESAASEAEGRFRAAIDLARQRAEKSLELRATASLAR
jgi:tetratricopeptide (TPR) repeat protein